MCWAGGMNSEQVEWKIWVIWNTGEIYNIYSWHNQPHTSIHVQTHQVLLLRKDFKQLACTTLKQPFHNFKTKSYIELPNPTKCLCPETGAWMVDSVLAVWDIHAWGWSSLCVQADVWRSFTFLFIYSHVHTFLVVTSAQNLRTLCSWLECRC